MFQVNELNVCHTTTVYIKPKNPSYSECFKTEIVSLNFTNNDYWTTGRITYLKNYSQFVITLHRFVVYKFNLFKTKVSSGKF